MADIVAGPEGGPHADIGSLYWSVTVQNIAALIAAACIVLGGWWMGAGGWSVWGLLALVALSDYPRVVTRAECGCSEDG